MDGWSSDLTLTTVDEMLWPVRKIVDQDFEANLIRMIDRWEYE
jgi:hypothetical protein